MLVLCNRLLDVPLMSLQTGGEVGRTHETIIDPRRLMIVAFYCEGQHIDFNPAVVHVSDIREFSSIGMIIDSADTIMAPDQLVRLQEVLSFKFNLIGKQVIEEGGRKIGKVVDYTTDTVTFYIAKLHVKPGLLQNFNSVELLIDRSQIKTIDDKQIIVKRATVREDSAPRPLHRRLEIDNPFRKPRPQAEAAESNPKDQTA